MHTYAVYSYFKLPILPQKINKGETGRKSLNSGRLCILNLQCGNVEQEKEEDEDSGR